MLLTADCPEVALHDSRLKITLLHFTLGLSAASHCTPSEMLPSDPLTGSPPPQILGVVLNNRSSQVSSYPLLWALV